MTPLRKIVPGRCLTTATCIAYLHLFFGCFTTRDSNDIGEREMRVAVFGLRRNLAIKRMSDAAFVLAPIKVGLALALWTVNQLESLAVDTCCQEFSFGNPSTPLQRTGPT